MSRPATHTGPAPVRETALTGEEVRKFWRDGFLRPGRLVSPDRVDILRRRLEEIREGHGSPSKAIVVDHLKIYERGESRDEPKPAIPLLTGLTSTESCFREVTFDRRLVFWISQLLGTPDLAFLLDQAIIKLPHVSGDFYWHQDWPAWPIAPSEVISCWVALEDVVLENGAMEMAVGTHALGRFLPRNASTGLPVEGQAVRDLEAAGMKTMPDPADLGLRVEPIELRAGEVSLHHGLTWHRSGPNETETTRHAFILRYADGSVEYIGKSFSALGFEDMTKLGMRIDETDLFPSVKVTSDIRDEPRVGAGLTIASVDA